MEDEEEREDERWCPRLCRCPRGCVEKGEEGPEAATAGAYAYGSYVDAYPESDVPVNVAGVACERGESESYSGGSNGFTFSALGGSFSPLRAVIIVFVFTSVLLKGARYAVVCAMAGESPSSTGCRTSVLRG